MITYNNEVSTPLKRSTSTYVHIEETLICRGIVYFTEGDCIFHCVIIPTLFRGATTLLVAVETSVVTRRSAS